MSMTTQTISLRLRDQHRRRSCHPKQWIWLPHLAIQLATRSRTKSSPKAMETQLDSPQIEKDASFVTVTAIHAVDMRQRSITLDSWSLVRLSVFLTDTRTRIASEAPSPLLLNINRQAQRFVEPTRSTNGCSADTVRTMRTMRPRSEAGRPVLGKSFSGCQAPVIITWHKEVRRSCIT